MSVRLPRSQRKKEKGGKLIVEPVVCFFSQTQQTTKTHCYATTVLPAKSDSDIM